jgi:hypothetical protein
MSYLTIKKLHYGVSRAQESAPPRPHVPPLIGARSTFILRDVDWAIRSNLQAQPRSNIVDCQLERGDELVLSIAFFVNQNSPRGAETTASKCLLLASPARSMLKRRYQSARRVSPDVLTGPLGSIKCFPVPPGEAAHFVPEPYDFRP